MNSARRRSRVSTVRRSCDIQGGDVRVVYSPLDAVKLAKANPEKQVVFFAIGFETTAPPNVMSVMQAKNLGLENYSILVSHSYNFV